MCSIVKLNMLNTSTQCPYYTGTRETIPVYYTLGYALLSYYRRETNKSMWVNRGDSVFSLSNNRAETIRNKLECAISHFLHGTLHSLSCVSKSIAMTRRA